MSLFGWDSFRPVCGKGEGKEFCSVSLYYSITLRWIFFPNNHHRIVLKECVRQSYMSSGGHRLLLVTISFQLTNNNNRYVVNDDKQGVCHIIALPFTLKSILRQKKNDGNSNISSCKNIIYYINCVGLSVMWQFCFFILW